MRLLRQHIQIRQEPRQGNMDLPQALAHGGDSVCPSRQIPENILFKKTQDVLGTDGLSPEILAERIGKILVPEHHRLVFQLKDEPDTETRWKYPSRRDAWTKEKRQLAREQAYERLRERKEKK